MSPQQCLITLNGEPKTCQLGQNITALLDELNLKKDVVVVEVNHKILKPEQFDSQPLNAGDQVEIIHFVGGG